jgi:hypothetical protein
VCGASQRHQHIFAGDLEDAALTLRDHRLKARRDICTFGSLQLGPNTSHNAFDKASTAGIGR